MAKRPRLSWSSTSWPNPHRPGYATMVGRVHEAKAFLDRFGFQKVLKNLMFCWLHHFYHTVVNAMTFPHFFWWRSCGFGSPIPTAFAPWILLALPLLECWPRARLVLQLSSENPGSWHAIGLHHSNIDSIIKYITWALDVHDFLTPAAVLDRWLTETKFKPSGSENARTHALFKRCRTRSIFRSLHETVSLVVLAQILFRGHVGKYSGNSWKHLQYLTIKFCCHPPSPNCWPLSFLISSVRLAASCGRLSFPPHLRLCVVGKLTKVVWLLWGVKEIRRRNPAPCGNLLFQNKDNSDPQQDLPSFTVTQGPKASNTDPGLVLGLGTLFGTNWLHAKPLPGIVGRTLCNSGCICTRLHA